LPPHRRRRFCVLITRFLRTKRSLTCALSWQRGQRHAAFGIPLGFTDSHAYSNTNDNRNSDCNTHRDRDPNLISMHREMYTDTTTAPDAGPAPVILRRGPSITL